MKRPFPFGSLFFAGIFGYWAYQNGRNVVSWFFEKGVDAAVDAMADAF